MIVASANYWFFAGVFYLLILTFFDYKRHMWVDDRINYLMFGLTLSLFSHFNRSLVPMLVTLLVSVLLYYYMKRFKVLGEADIKTITWSFLGFAIISLDFVLYYGLLLICVSLLFYGLKLLVFKYKRPVPFYPVLLVTYLLTIFWVLII